MGFGDLPRLFIQYKIVSWARGTFNETPLILLQVNDFMFVWIG